MKLLLTILGGVLLCIVLLFKTWNASNPHEVLRDFMLSKESRFESQKLDSNHFTLLYIPTQVAVLNALRTSGFNKKDYVRLEKEMAKSIRFELRNYGIHQKKKIDILNEIGHRQYERSIRDGFSLVIAGKRVFPIEFVPERTYGMLPYDTYFVSFVGDGSVSDMQVLMEFENTQETLSWEFKKEEVEYNVELNWN